VRGFSTSVRCTVETVVDVIMDEGLLCLTNRFLNGVELLREVKAWALVLYHFYDMAQMPLGPLEPPDYRWVCLVEVVMVISHDIMVSSPGG